MRNPGEFSHNNEKTDMDNAARISTIIPVYNGAAYLQAAVDSALKQDFGDQEIIIVNDGSTDGSATLADELAASRPNVRVIHQENSGPCLARNKGIDAARGEFIALLDADDVWLPHHLREVMAEFSAKPHLGLVHTHVQVIGLDGNLMPVSEGRWPSQTAAWSAMLMRAEHIACTTAVFRKSLFDQVGGFDMAFNRLGCEDRDLWLKMLMTAQASYLDAVHALYRLHANQSSNALDRMLKARVLLVERHCGKHQDLMRPALASAYTDAGMEYRSIRRFGSAIGAFSKALMLSPVNPRAWRALIGAICRRT